MRYARRAALAAAALAAATAVPALAGSSPAHRAGPVDTYRAYDLGLTGGEPSIGFDPRRDRALYASGMTVLRLAWNATGRLTSANVTPAQSLTT
ncbi:MAG TPA: hypothetical protein VNE21_07360, partial [Mycobacteriales bacterium]|nr:hypothetical protein [Mycobacteriales bacterium]